MANLAELRDHRLPGHDEPIERLLIGPMGVFVVGAAARGRLARRAQESRVRREQRAVRELLDAAGLCALPAVGVVCADVGALVEHAQSDVRFGPSTVRAARLALDPPPFIATVAETRKAASPVTTRQCPKATPSIASPGGSLPTWSARS